MWHRLTNKARATTRCLTQEIPRTAGPSRLDIEALSMLAAIDDDKGSGTNQEPGTVRISLKNGLLRAESSSSKSK